MANITDAHKAALRQFRERHKQAGLEPGKAVARFRHERKAVESALKQGPATVPQIAQAAGLPAHVVLWHLAGMRKYGAAREVDMEGDYPRYEWVAASAKTAAPS